MNINFINLDLIVLYFLVENRVFKNNCDTAAHFPPLAFISTISNPVFSKRYFNPCFENLKKS